MHAFLAAEKQRGAVLPTVLTKGFKAVGGVAPQVTQSFV
jgi:hypothetical protein